MQSFINDIDWRYFTELVFSGLTKGSIYALISLGYKPQEASKAVSAIKDKTLSSEDMIRRALKGMI